MNTKLRCLLLDDEIPGLTYLRIMCEQLPSVEVVKAFNDPLKFVEEIKKLDFDFCILDIEMPGLNGLEVAHLLQNKPIIFTTAYKEYAAEAFDLEAIDYICKPIKKERLERAIHKAAQFLRKSGPEKQFIQLNTHKGKALLFFDQILYITTDENDKRDKLAMLDSGQQIILKNISFAQLLDHLPAKNFCRVNKKDIIAFKAVRFFTHDEITTSLTDPLGKEITLTLSDTYRADFMHRL